MAPILEISGVSKTYDNDFKALNNVSLTIEKGEIFALLGPNGAGKTTLISIICGIANANEGSVVVDGYDNIQEFRKARSVIGLVPQEIPTAPFEPVMPTVMLSRGLFGLPSNPARIEEILKDLSLWEKRNNQIMTLSGGMKRRLLMAKALAHEPKILFLDEPTAGVDVELRHDMWRIVRKLRDQGVTIVLTTHYIEEAEEMADRVGVISKGELIVVEQKATLMDRLGQKELTLRLMEPLTEVPSILTDYDLKLSDNGRDLTFIYASTGERTGITRLLGDLDAAGIRFHDLETRQSSLEDIFVDLVRT